ncbi:hypothetical protein DV113_003812 [Geotrichum candidum]|uniref:endo-polygalacturonase n=1 Tax=Geotrichum candidum TaxID=1173061 RepID=A0A0J9XAK5_GEOCN|nr:hypothetical protein DV452_003557 [Geotrichum candidum]KAI9210866.1 hypothetical protein DS838_004244 [Geotrichum bryndzae]KAF5116784.1 hypothetical protein DV454_001468 [Geotrichum candidum]KAF7498142.1 hypothetical protein DV113_003812 [Geotrichum candidum]KAI8131592.1 hypothetical protein DUD61_004740 [Geotrichum candidum]
MILSKCTLLAAMAGMVTAAPINKNVCSSESVCTFTDAHSAISGKNSCSVIILDNIEVPAGETLDLTGLNKGTTVIFSGTTSFGYKEWKGPLISVSGDSIIVKQAPGGRISGGGERWWDGQGGNGGKLKPKLFYAHQLQNSHIDGLQIFDTPVHTFSIQSDHLSLSNILIDDSAGDRVNGGHNTDAFGVSSSTYITIDNAKVYNQDDCMAVNSGDYIIFQNGYCSGGHGLSIGSVGGRANNNVTNVLIRNSQIVNSENGVRIKSVSEATGLISGITYENISLTNISRYGIDIQQDYLNGGPTGTPTNGVSITDITLKNIHGTVQSSGTDIYLLCGTDTCTNWNWQNINVTGGTTSNECTNIPSGVPC